MSTTKTELWIQRGVAVLVVILSFVIFIPVGGLFYIFLLLRATISLTLSSFISAMTGASISANVQQLLHQSVSFFPNGLGIIWNASKAVWLGENFGSTEQKYTSVTLLTNLILAILFFVVLTLLLNALGWSGVRVPAIIGWFFGTPILLLLSFTVLAVLFIRIRPIAKEFLRRVGEESNKPDAPSNP